MTGEPEPLAVLLLPCRLEDFELGAHAQDLLAIPRVVALEPWRGRVPRALRDSVSALQARRLRFPGEPRAFVLYHPAQYPLARALLGVHQSAELWYVARDPGTAGAGSMPGSEKDELTLLDELARARARHVLVADPDRDAGAQNEPLRTRLSELGVINHRPFVPGLRARSRKGVARAT